MNFAIAIDRNFIIQACTLIKSLELTQKENSVVFILNDDLTPKDFELMKNQFNQNKIELFFLHAKLDNFDLNIENKVHLSKATYFRLYLTELLPRNIERIIYLDCDMIVLKDLSELYNTDFNNKSCCAVIDMFNNSKEIYTRLDYPRDSGYFNSGLLLINIPQWKKEKISEKALNFIQNNPERCIAHDQDALNKAISGNFIKLSVSYNMQLDFFRDFTNSILNEEYYDDISTAVKQPYIIHFTGPTKPWFKNCLHPYKKHWCFFCSKTIWKNNKSKYFFETPIKKLNFIIKIFCKTIHFYSFKKSFTKEAYSYANLSYKNLERNYEKNNYKW